MSIGRQQYSIRDVTQLAFLFLQLCPEEGRAVQIPVLVLGIGPLLRQSIVSSNKLGAVVYDARWGKGMVVVCCARRVGHVGLGAGDHFIRLVTVVPGTLAR